MKVGRRWSHALAVGAVLWTVLPAGTAFAEPALPDPAPTSTAEEDTFEYPHLDVAPYEVAPGTTFTATASSIGSCDTLDFSWEYGRPDSATDNIDTTTAVFTVPSAANAGDYLVSAWCDGIPTTADLVVLPAAPELTLSPAEGPAGTPLTATITGCSSQPQTPTELQWDGELLSPSTAGTFEVPTDAVAGTHEVSATCGSASAETGFTVLVPVTPPSLTLDKTAGTSDSQILVSGNGFGCAGEEVELRWDDHWWATTRSGSFTATLTVPSEVSIGGHTVTASCADNPDIVADSTFTVTPDPTTGPSGEQVPVTADPPTSPTPTPTPTAKASDTELTGAEDNTTDFPFWIIVPAVVAVLLVGLGLRYRRPRESPEPTTQVHATTHLGDAPTVTVHETPGQHSHGIRLHVHSGSVTHTISEVRDDHNRP